MTAEPDLRLGAAPRVILDVCQLGAAIHRLEATSASGERLNVVLGYPEGAHDREAGLYLGVTVGRYANRIAGSRFTLDGHEYQLAANDRGHNLHGGPAGFDTRVWDVVSSESGRAVLELVSPDGDQGFPGTLTVRAQISVDGDTVQLAYTATRTGRPW